jgi:hypothetical protein
MLQIIEIETKKGKQKEFILQCDFCSSKSRSSLELEKTLFKARQDGWITRYGTGRTVRTSQEVEILDAGKNGPAIWCCTNCVRKEQHLPSEEKLQRKILGLSQEELDRICQP